MSKLQINRLVMQHFSYFYSLKIIKLKTALSLSFWNIDSIVDEETLFYYYYYITKVPLVTSLRACHC